MRKVKKPIWIALLVVSIVILVSCCVLIFRYLRTDDTPSLIQHGTAAGETAAAATTADETEADEATSAPTQAPTQAETLDHYGYDTVEYEEVTLSFDEMMEINPDIYAWIYVPGTAVDYPVAQNMRDRDDSFYLSHNIYREYQFSGTIYSEVQNSIDFDDPVTVLYGHNMLNGSMFASLLNFEDSDFFDQNNTIFIFTKDKLYTYLIYSAYTYDDRHILNSFDMSNDEVFAEYLETTLEPHSYNANVREGVQPDTDSRILTLSTCTSGASNTRYLVQGVLVNEQLRTTE